MTPRARSVHDSVIALSACTLLIERGAEAVTFAQVAKECGLAPPTLVQRFASRDGMLRAVVEVLHTRVASAFSDAGRTASPLPALRAALVELAPQIGAALQLSRSVDVAHYSLELRKQISYTLAVAVEAGELPRCNVAELARTIQISVTGAVAVALLEGNPAASEVVRAVDAQLTDFIGV